MDAMHIHICWYKFEFCLLILDRLTNAKLFWQSNQSKKWRRLIWFMKLNYGFIALCHMTLYQTILLQKREKLLLNTASSFTKSSSKNTHKHSGKNCYFRFELGSRTCLKFFREMYGIFFTLKNYHKQVQQNWFFLKGLAVHWILTCTQWWPNVTFTCPPELYQVFLKNVNDSLVSVIRFSFQSQENSNVYYVEMKWSCWQIVKHRKTS